MDRKILLQNLADSVAERTGITKRKAEAFVRSFFEVTEEGLIADGIVKTKGFGTTKIVAVSGRESVNINTGERFQIEGHDKVTFTPDAPFRDLVNRPFAHFTTTILADNLDEAEFDAANLPQPEPETVDIEEKTVNEEPPVEKEAPVEEETPFEVVAPTEEEAAPTEEEAPAEQEVSLVEEVLTEEEVPTEEEATDETDTSAEDNQESTQTSETTEDMQQPIIIQNTIPETRHNWWRVAFVVLATLVLMTLSYFAGYYRVFCPCDWETPSQPEKTTAQSSVPQNTTTEKTKVTTQPTDDAKVDAPAPATNAEPKETKEQAAAELAAAKANEEKKLREAAKKYRQMDGNYLITGVLETHEMKVGDNLYKLAKQAYGDKKLVSYIIFHNNISNPDLVNIGQTIEIPKLMEK